MRIAALAFLSGLALMTPVNYPKSLVWNGYLLVAYATNKEDVQVTRVPLAVLMAY